MEEEQRASEEHENDLELAPEVHHYVNKYANMVQHLQELRQNH